MAVDASGGIAGFCGLAPSRDPDADAQAVAEIAGICLLPQYWRQGVGRALCERALAAARTQACRHVTLWVLAANDRAKRFYESLGFQPDGAAKTVKMADGSELPEVRFRLAIWP